MPASATECPLTIEWETLAPERQPRVVTEYSLESDYLVSTDRWEATVYDTDPERLKWLALQPVKLLIHENLQLFGRVEHVTRGRNGNEVTISGRDHISAIVECNIDPTVRVTEDMTLATVVVLVAGPCGIDTAFGEGDAQTRSIKSGASLQAGTDPGFADLQPGNLKPEPGMGIYEWLNRIAARMGCTIQPGPTRSSVLLVAPNYTTAPIATFKRSRDPGAVRSNNIEDASSSEDYSSFPTVGLATGKISSTGKAAQAAAKTYPIADVIREAAANLYAKIGDLMHPGRLLPSGQPGDPLKLYRLLYVKDEQSRKPEQVERAIARAVSERLRSTLDYEVTVKGHRDVDTGYVYAIDTMATVRDEVCDIDENLWCASRAFSFSRSEGAKTRMRYWRPGSLIL
jgi:prophage tail gpP-like protein